VSGEKQRNEISLGPLFRKRINLVFND